MDKAVDVMAGPRPWREPREERAPVVQSARTLLERPVCPLCGAMRGVATTFPTKHGVALDPTAGISASQTFSIVRCDVCGVRYTSPRLKREWRRLGYPSSFPFFTRALAARAGQPQDEPELTRERRALLPRARRLLELHPRSGRLLDIGMGDGLFLDVMRAHGWDVAGVDAEESVVWFARERLGLRDAHVLDVEEDALPPGPFDVVSVFGALQLVYRPQRLLARIRDVLAPGGILVIGVFNAKSAAERLLGPRGYGFGLPLQLVHYTPETLRRLVEWTGYESLRLGFETPRWVLERNLDRALAEHGPMGSLAKTLSLAAGPLLGRTPLGETIELYARKKAS